MVRAVTAAKARLWKAADAIVVEVTDLIKVVLMAAAALGTIAEDQVVICEAAPATNAMMELRRANAAARSSTFSISSCRTIGRYKLSFEMPANSGFFGT
jgi:hypothetical protein